VTNRVLLRVFAFLLCLPRLAFSGAVDCGRKTPQQWDEGEARILRTAILPELTTLTDYAQIRDVFEKAIAGDPAAASGVSILIGHSNDDVAGFAAAALGRFPSAEAARLLKETFDTDGRHWVRIGALAGLERMGDPETGAYAVRALSDAHPQVQAAGGATITSLGDSRYGPALLAYYDQHKNERVILEWLGCVGDAPGSTVVRDLLLTEANNKALDFSRRVRAAYGLEEMGHADLVRRILDRQKGDQSHQTVRTTEGAIRRLAAKRGMTIRSQADVDTLLVDANLGHHGDDMWGHPIRVKFIREDQILASSDGPDGVLGTEDDLTSTESYGAWAYRVFPEQF
jgi:hypothetical protein